MSLFEYVSVIVAVVLALGLSQLLLGVATLIKARRRVEVYAPHSIWLLNLFILLLLHWWAIWDLNEAAWTSVSFFYVVLGATLLFLSVSLHVPEVPTGSPIILREHFLEVRRLFMMAMFAFIVLVWFDGALITGQSPWGRATIIHLGWLGALAAGFLSDGTRINVAAACAAGALTVLNLIFRFFPGAFA